MQCSKIDLDNSLKKKKNWYAKINSSLKRSLSDIEMWRSSAAEFVATFLLIFIICISTMNLTVVDATEKYVQTIRSVSCNHDMSLQESAAISLSYATLIHCFEHISGGHMNPAISLAMFAAGNISFLQTFLHVIFQLGGGIIAVLLFYGFAPGHKDKLADIFPRLHPNLQPWQGFCIEFIQGLLLSITWLSSYSSNRKQLGSSAISVGFCLLANSLWANTLTGSSVNPARSIPLVIFFRKFDDILWVYLAGPIVGCLTGALLYQQLFVTIPPPPISRLNTSGSLTSGDSECGLRQVETVTSPIRDKAEGKRDDDVTSFGLQRTQDVFLNSREGPSIRLLPLDQQRKAFNHQQRLSVITSSDDVMRDLSAPHPARVNNRTSCDLMYRTGSSSIGIMMPNNSIENEQLIANSVV